MSWARVTWQYWVGAYEHVGRLEVAVDDGRVGRVEEGAALGDVLGDLEHEHVPALVDHLALRRPLIPVQELEEVALHAPTHHQVFILSVVLRVVLYVVLRVVSCCVVCVVCRVPCAVSRVALRGVYLFHILQHDAARVEGVSAQTEQVRVVQPTATSRVRHDEFCKKRRGNPDTSW